MSSPKSPAYQQRASPSPPSPRRPMRRPAYRAAKAFYITLFLGLCLFTYSLLAHDYVPDSATQHDVVLQKRGHGGGRGSNSPISPFQNADEQCRLVHKSQDKCAFIHKSCPTDDPSFTFLLDLYFCQIPHLKPLVFLLLFAWLGLLFSTIGIAASDFFCINLSTIASILGMSESMAGVTFLAFGNGSPDVFSTFAAMRSHSGSLAVGELFGAAGFITAVVAGSMALIRPFHVARKSFIRDVGFFVVAAAFSMVFLWDGRLQLWECIAMVLFYLAYVTFVVIWHWWLGRRRRRREKEAAARGHFLAPGDELDGEGEYHDDPGEAAVARRPSVHRGVSAEDWSALESGGTPYLDGGLDEDEEEEARDRWMSELNSNMRLTRPQVRSRKNTISSVRPSLVGALEFQAVMKGLQKSRNLQTIPMNARRYSDDPSFTTAQQQEHMSNSADPAARPPFQITVDGAGSPTIEPPPPGFNVPLSAPGRMRAVSANGAEGLHIDPEFGRALTRVGSPSQSDVIDSTADRSQLRTSPSLLGVPGRASQPQSPTLQITPPPESAHVEGRGLHIDTSVASRSRLTPQSNARRSFFRSLSDHFGAQSTSKSPRNVTPLDSSRGAASATPLPAAHMLPKIVHPRHERQHSRESSRASSPFPTYYDDPMARSGHFSRRSTSSLQLPPPIASPESLPVSQSAEQLAFPTQQQAKAKWRYWPYAFLPPPGVLISTFFPTIYHWGEKTWWEKLLGVSAAPSVLLLTLTLPVVENENDKEEKEAMAGKGRSYDTGRSKTPASGGWEVNGHNANKGAMREDVREDGNEHPRMNSLAQAGIGEGVAGLAADTEWHYRHNAGDDHTRQPKPHRPALAHNASTMALAPKSLASPSSSPSLSSDKGPEPWNRWLTTIHLYTSPLTVLLSIYLQAPDSLTLTWLLKPTLISLLLSTILLIPFLLTTSPFHRPKPYTPILSGAGFIVSIAWISAIADRVVSSLKALAVIGNMSHAIMGLTIFAVGNSLGDLVADVTVARLGYPVMALSACFGGPMLNILLGIGVSGSWILISGAEKRHRKHPGREWEGDVRSYHIDVSTTLIVSGFTLLAVLVGLLVAVPMGGWVMSRRIGWCLIGVWVVSTVGNVIVEVLGVGQVDLT
ncbi:hypothetical protein LTR62_005504 [Meristemomyces frigidus]|uniref:Sodium/calcium exchanger membrane region domain-containing protein n=1 Tax=Meristemomyces frigidus TaxID=1508187 RepID=A0AAN7YQP5_9PEZI|nr:hypothetical protein LTR62_005504 [Meristemomyces frigidus]